MNMEIERIIVTGDFGWLAQFLITRVSIVLVCWLFMAIACLIDFWSGTDAARAIGEPLQSRGFRRTIEKMGDYIKVLMFGLMFDILGQLLPFYSLPFATILVAVAEMAIEGRSVIENSRRKKAHAADVPDMVRQIVKAVTAEQGREVLGRIVEMIGDETKHSNE